MVEKFTCELCGGLPKSKANYEKHLKTKKHILKAGGEYKPEKEYRCEKCNCSFASKKTYDIHMLTDKHKNGGNKPKKQRREKAGRPPGTVIKKTVECDKCNRLFSSVYHMEKHRQTHSQSTDQSLDGISQVSNTIKSLSDYPEASSNPT